MEITNISLESQTVVCFTKVLHVVPQSKTVSFPETTDIVNQSVIADIHQVKNTDPLLYKVNAS